jgi:transcription antitermination factor NusG
MGTGQQLCEAPLALPLFGAAMGARLWYAVQTLARHEKKVTAQLEEKGVTTFLPLVTEVHRWSDRRKVVEVPLFSCYAFVHMGPSVEGRLLVVQTPGVIGFVGIHGVGTPIPDKEIEDIQTLLTHHAGCAPYPFLNVGKRVRIRGGCFDGVEGILVGKNSDRSLVVSIELIQRSVAVRFDGYDVEAIS